MTVRICLLLFTLIFLANAQDRRAELEIEINEAKQEIYCWNLVEQLDLSLDQVRELWKLSQEVKPLVEEYRRNEALHLISFEQALLRFHEEVARGELSEEAQEEAGYLERHGKKMKKQFADTINGFEEKAREILTPNQLVLVENYEPQLSSATDKKQDKDLVTFLLEVRKMSDADFERKAPRQVRRHLKKFEKKHEKADLPSEEEVMRVLRLVRELPDREFQENLDVIVDRLLPKTQARKAKEELRRIEDETHGHIGNIGKFLLSPYCIPHYERLLGSEK